MLADSAWFKVLRTLFTILLDVLFFWYNLLRRPSPRTIYTRALANARSYEEWEAAAFQLDTVLGNDLWRQNAASKYYDYRLIYERLQAIITARESEDVLGLINLLRAGLVRNLGNITTARLYDRACAGTKLLIEDYVTQVALAIDAVAASPTTNGHPSGLTSQYKLDFLHDTRQAFGRTALLLQGGAIFGLCHLGIVKSLHLRGLLPRIIVGTGAGALVAALVGVHSEHELVDVLSARFFTSSNIVVNGRDETEKVQSRGRFSSITRRLNLGKSYFADVAALEKHVMADLGDITFEEAYSRTRRVLSISEPDDYAQGIPSLFNYLTTPNVLIRTAAAASNTPTTSSPSQILHKDQSGKIQTWSSSHPTFKARTPFRHTSSHSHSSPLTRVAELFNVNHYIVSQARPYLTPFLRTSASSISSSSSAASSRRRTPLVPILRVTGLEVQHRLRQLDTFGLIPSSIRRFLVEDTIPSAHITLVPELAFSDLFRLDVSSWRRWSWPWQQRQMTTQVRIEQWILRGERSVWPAVTALKVRCAVENEVDRAYQIVRRRKPQDYVGSPNRSGNTNGYGTANNLLEPGSPAVRSGLKGAGEKRKRRASGTGGSGKLYIDG